MFVPRRQRRSLLLGSARDASGASTRHPGSRAGNPDPGRACRAVSQEREAIEVMNTIAPVKIAVANSDAPRGRTLREQPTVWASDGLAVTRSHNIDRAWAVTHIASGYSAIDGFSRKRDAISAAKVLLELGDWTRAR